MKLSDQKRESILRLLDLGLSNRQIVRIGRVSPKTVQRVKAGEGFDPKPDEIAAKCREIQAGWSDNTRRRRLTCRLPSIKRAIPET